MIRFARRQPLLFWAYAAVIALVTSMAFHVAVADVSGKPLVVMRSTQN